MFHMACMVAAFLSAACFASGQEGADGYDALPARYADMDEYDRIAMEPYRDSYDSMPLDEKVRTYAVVFEFMRNRPPRFPPEVTAAVRRHEQARQSRDAYEAKQHLYKPPPAPSAGGGGDARVLRRLPGPWEREPAPIARKEEEAEPPGGGALMESLRFGTGAARRARE